MKEEESCNKVDCDSFRSSGDNIFCERHRNEWRTLCATGGITNALPDEKIMMLLEAYKEGKIINRGDLNGEVFSNS